MFIGISLKDRQNRLAEGEIGYPNFGPDFQDIHVYFFEKQVLHPGTELLYDYYGDRSKKKKVEKLILANIVIRCATSLVKIFMNDLSSTTCSTVSMYYRPE